MAADEAKAFAVKAKFRFTVIFPEGCPLSGWAESVQVLGPCHVHVRDLVLELPNTVEGIRLGIAYVRHSEFTVVGGMVTFFPLPVTGK